MTMSTAGRRLDSERCPCLRDRMPSRRLSTASRHTGCWAEQARTELRATGGSARRREPGTIERLTPQELRIARLVAEGTRCESPAGR